MPAFLYIATPPGRVRLCKVGVSDHPFCRSKQYRVRGRRAWVMHLFVYTTREEAFAAERMVLGHFETKVETIRAWKSEIAEVARQSAGIRFEIS